MPEPRQLDGSTFSSKSRICSFQMRWLVASMEELDTFEPPSLPLGLPITDRKGVLDNGDWILTLTHEGVRDGVEVEETFELDGSTSEEPIETLPDFQALAKKYKAVMDGDKLEGWSQTVTIDGKAVKNPLLGVTAYLATGAVWRRSFGTPDFPDGLLKELGCIYTPTGAKSPPALPEGRTWLKRSLKAVWRGNIWQVTEEGLASGPGGWNRDIYRVR